MTESEFKKFDDDGYVVCRGVLAQDELDACQAESQRLIEEILAGGPADKSCGRGPEGVPYYLHYLHSHPNDFSLRLLAHPFVGDAMRRLSGPDWIPLWESLVFKLPNRGSSVPWHRDDFATTAHEKHRTFNIDFYFDKAFPENACVWVVPGSHQWEEPKAREWIDRGAKNFDLPGAVPAEMEPGDVLFHSTRVLHGSTVNKHPSLRRVVYFDSRSLRWNEEHRAFHPDLLRRRNLMYQHALHLRKTKPYASDDETASYSPPAGMPVYRPGQTLDLKGERIPHPESR